MKTRFIRKTLALLAILQFAFLPIFVSTVAVVPTAQCHCHDGKSTPKQRSQCPFGQLRGLAQLLSIVPPTTVEVVRTQFAIEFDADEPEVVPLRIIPSVESRAPPMLV